jgi:hypothetical protein
MSKKKPQVVAASLVLSALVVGIIWPTMGLFEAHRQRREAEKRLTQIEKANETLGSVFTDLDPTNDEKDAKPLRERLGERLDQATAWIEGEAMGDPLMVARPSTISRAVTGSPRGSTGQFLGSRGV